ncbi:EFFECTOR OF TRANSCRIPTION 2-like protein [Drosera capensis]
MAPSPPPAISTLRLEREEHHQTKHDAAFSRWRVLIGPSDWSDHASGKQGAERYRVQNLPSVSGPGLYEIGVTVWRTGSGRDVAKMEASDIVVVYLGEADNVKARLQRHGRGGSHLGSGGNWGVGSSGDGVGSGLFKEVFERGFPIVYRWAPMNSKMDAKRTEAQLLAKFDYAWNKVENGSRRPNDILQKIDKISSQTFQVPRIFKRLQAISHKQVGITIKPSQPPTNAENNPNGITHIESHNLVAQVFKIGRSRPKLVFNRPSIVEDTALTYDKCCDESIRNNYPVDGEKRCYKHEDKRSNKSSSSPQTASSLTSGSSGAAHDPDCFAEEKFPVRITDPPRPCSKDLPSICGFILLDGSPCMEQPSRGRKRCKEHKGRRVAQSVIPSRYLRDDTVESLVYSSSSSSSFYDQFCGMILSDGSCCKQQAVKGRKRCKEHKGMRVKGLAS